MSGLTPARREALRNVAQGSVIYYEPPLGPVAPAYERFGRKYRSATIQWLHDQGYIAHESTQHPSLERVVLTEKGREAL